MDTMKRLTRETVSLFNILTHSNVSITDVALSLSLDVKIKLNVNLRQFRWK